VVEKGKIETEKSPVKKKKTVTQAGSLNLMTQPSQESPSTRQSVYKRHASQNSMYIEEQQRVDSRDRSQKVPDKAKVPKQTT
jgi:hypothetical protein